MKKDGLGMTVTVTVTVVTATLQKWIPKVTDIDNRMHALEASLKDQGKGASSQSRQDRRQDRPTFMRTVTTTSQASRTPAASLSGSHDAHVPMEVDAIRCGPLTQEEKDHHRRVGLCLYCGQSGHMISKCPNGAKPRTTPKAPASSEKA
ncbi:hypothetical protein C8Q76DRAFT_799174 [Earliella scabrosa]|nr:hypothetical protein C8Q76DRAFT_799174 [Earliella scabrosa]